MREEAEASFAESDVAQREHLLPNAEGLSRAPLADGTQTQPLSTRESVSTTSDDE